MADPTPEQAGSQLVAIRKQIAALDAQADGLVSQIVELRSQLTVLAAQRQPLVDQAETIVRAFLIAPWRDVLRNAGDPTPP